MIIQAEDHYDVSEVIKVKEPSEVVVELGIFFAPLRQTVVHGPN